MQEGTKHLHRFWWFWRPALPKGRKYQMVETQTEPLDEANSLNKPN